MEKCIRSSDLVIVTAIKHTELMTLINFLKVGMEDLCGGTGHGLLFIK
jgi:hypothetical protein